MYSIDLLYLIRIVKSTKPVKNKTFLKINYIAVQQYFLLLKFEFAFDVQHHGTVLRSNTLSVSKEDYIMTGTALQGI